MKDFEKIGLRSEEFREILGTPPRWFVQFGTTIAAISFLVIGLFSYCFTYPDIVKAPIRISTSDPPHSIISRSYGILENMVAEHSVVKEGNVLAVLKEYNANVQDILLLAETVEGLEDFEEEFEDFQQDKSLKLGSVEAAYLSFVELHKRFKLTRVSQFHDKRIDRLNEKKEELELEIEVYQERINEIEDEITNLEGPRKEQLKQLIEEHNSSIEYVQRQQERIQDVKKLRREQDEIGQEIREKHREIGDIDQQKLEIRQGWQSDKSSVASDFRSRLYDLKEAIHKWEEEHLIVAPTSGKVYYADLLKSGEEIAKEGESIMAIVPTDAEDHIRGKMYVPASDASKVHIGQQVNIRFEAYPVTQFGLLVGEVMGKAEIANEDGKKMITIKVSNLTTTNQKNIPFEFDMQGVAHIITEKRPLLFRFFEFFVQD